MKYRVVYTISDCLYYSDIFDTFEEAKKYYDFENIKHHFAWIEKSLKARWYRMSELEIKRALLKYNKIKKVTICTDTYNYTYTLPKELEVPSDLSKENTTLYIVAELLNLEKEITEK